MGMAYNEIDIMFVTVDGEKHYYECGLPDEMQAELTDTILFTKATSIDDIINEIGYGFVDSDFENEGENYFEAVFDDAGYWYYSDKLEQLQLSDIKTIILMTNTELAELDRRYDWVLYDLKSKRRRSGSVEAKRDPESDSFYGEIWDMDPMPQEYLESLSGPGKDRLQSKKPKSEVPSSSYRLAGDHNFIRDSGRFKYSGKCEYVIIPELIHGENVDTYGCMFSGTDSYGKGPRNLENLKGVASSINNVSYMGAMFFKNINLYELDLSHLDTSNVENMELMFCDCHELRDLKLSNFDTSRVKYMSGMFKGCNNLLSLDLGRSTLNRTIR